MQSQQTSSKLLKAARLRLTRRALTPTSANSNSALPPGTPPRCLYRVASESSRTFATSAPTSACSPRLAPGRIGPALARLPLSRSLSTSSSVPLSTSRIYQTRRTYSTSPPPSSPPTVFADPHRPDLFYHLVHAPPSLPAYALSFLKETPPSADSAVVLGWLPAQTQETGTSAGLNDFKENPKFLALLHTSIKSALLQGLDEIWINAAIQYQNGWMHIHDQRNIPALDRIGDSEDIIASVFVENGVMNLATYAPMPSYRLCTADGITQLTPGLARYLLEELEELGRVRT